MIVTTHTYHPIPEDDIEVIDSTDFGAPSSTRQPMNSSEQSGNKITLSAILIAILQ